MQRTLLSVIVVCAVLLRPTHGFAAPDDIEAVPAPAAGNANFAIDESNFDQWVFGGGGNGKVSAGRERLKSLLTMQLDEVNRTCGLTDAQQQKLTLAARGDTKRFFEQVDVVRKKFLEVRQDQNAFGQIWQDIQPLQMKYAAGLFGDKSFYARTLSKTLSAEQAVKYKAVTDERRRFRYQAAVEVAMTMLENAVALRHEQRDALIRILIDKTQPPIAFGQYDFYFVLYRLARLPEKDLRSLLDERQWTLLQPQLNQGRGMKATLIQNGVLDPNDADGNGFSGSK